MSCWSLQPMRRSLAELPAALKIGSNCCQSALLLCAPAGRIVAPGISISISRIHWAWSSRPGTIITAAPPSLVQRLTTFEGSQGLTCAGREIDDAMVVLGPPVGKDHLLMLHERSPAVPARLRS